VSCPGLQCFWFRPLVLCKKTNFDHSGCVVCPAVGWRGSGLFCPSCIDFIISLGRIRSPGPRLWNSAASRNVVRRVAPAVQRLAIGDRRFFNRQKHVFSLGTFTLVGHPFQLVDSCTDAVGIELYCAKTRVLKSSAAHQLAWEKNNPLTSVFSNERS
jgi:hypothetical protein